MPSLQAKVVERSVGPPSPGPGLASTAASPAGRSASHQKDKNGLDDLRQYTARLLQSLPARPLPTTGDTTTTAALPEPRTHPEQSSSISSPPRNSTESEATPSSPSSSASHASTSPSTVDTEATSHDGESDDEFKKQSAGHTSVMEQVKTTPTVSSHTVPPISPRTPSQPPKSASLSLDRESREDFGRDEALGGGCREAVEILTRTQKKGSYCQGHNGPFLIDMPCLQLPTMSRKTASKSPF